MTVSFDPSRGQATPVESELGAGLADVATAARLLRDCAEDFDRLREKVRAGEWDGLKDATRIARELRAASLLLFEERNKVDKLRKDIAGAVGPSDLDLGAARDEIGRRLAQLRRAAGH